LGTAPYFQHDGIVFHGLHSRKGLNSMLHGMPAFHTAYCLA